MKLFYALILCSLSFISIHAQNRSVESIGFADVIVMEVSPSGNVWVGSVTQGCSAYIASSHTWSTFTTLNSSMESDSITCIALYAINTVPHSFMGTTHGIGYRHGTTWDTLAGLIDPRVVDIIRSGADHRLYVATAGGISMYNDTLLTHTTDYSAGSASCRFLLRHG
jgi:ligand-binding sensor domain-containing protein